jgi:cytochrome b561
MPKRLGDEEDGLAMGGETRTASAPAGYSARQIALHWIVFVLVAFQFAIGNQMTHLFRAAHGGNPTDANAIWAPIHITVGLLILIAMLARVALRRLDGVPAPPKQHPALEWLAGAVHAGLYVDLIGAPIVGLIAYVWLSPLAGLHQLMTRPILVALFVLHFAGALWHRFVVRDDVMTRIVRPAG